MTYSAGFAVGAQITPLYDFKTTNATAITNGQSVVSALLAGDSSRVQALVGSQVAFRGYGSGGSMTNHPANLMISSNIILDVEIVPARNMIRPCCVWWADVLGTLKSVDFEKRVIYIQARLEDWHLGPPS